MKLAPRQTKLTVESLEMRTLLAVDMLAHIDIKGDVAFTPRDVSAFQDNVIVRGTDGHVGPEAWITDGNPESTRLLKDIRVGALGSGPRDFLQFNGKLYFGANNGFSGYELWATDGSRAGTQQISDIWPGAESGVPSDITIYRGELYFFANDGESGRELYRSNGTVGGTERIVDAIEGRQGVSGENMMLVGDLLFFQSVGRTPEAAGIWVSDGTADGTKQVQIPVVETNDIRLMTRVGDQLVFASANKLFITDGTALGSRELSVEGTGLGSDFNGLAAMGGQLYVSSASGLRIVDPSLTTSVLVTANSDGVTVSSGKAYFWNSTGFHAVESEDAFTELVHFRSFFGTKMGGVHEVPGGILLNINKVFNDFGIWGTDGTVEGTKLIETVTDASAEPLAGFQRIGDSIYFTATNGKLHASLWKVPAPIFDVIETNSEGDVNGDELVDAQDIDAIFAAAASGSTDLIYDLNSDNQVTRADGEYIVTEIFKTRNGDLDLNGRVDFTDFLKLSISFGKQDLGWSDGDVNGDGSVGFADFLLLSSNFGFTHLATALDDDHE